MIAALAIIATSVLHVGTGKTYQRIEDALAVAHAGDTIEVHEGTYERVAILIRIPNLHILAKGKVNIDAREGNYSGVGSVPRAVFQFEPSADGGSVEGFDISGAHNDSHNGAAVRINCAKYITVKGCRIHGNDMGIMSNGRKDDPEAARGQRIESCEIYQNGDPAEPGYNHNLYLGGTSVVIDKCNIHNAVTGHNVKSRAHYTEIRQSWIHYSANRECDFVEAWDTERLNSNVAILGCLIEKDPNCTGNRGVLNFGAEHGIRNGSIYIISSELRSPFASPILQVTSPASHVCSIASAFFVKSSIVEGNYVLSGFGNSVTGTQPSQLPSDWLAPAKKPYTYVDGEGKTRSWDPKLRFGS